MGHNIITYTVKCESGEGHGHWATGVNKGGQLIIAADSSTPGITVSGFDPQVIKDPPSSPQSIGAGTSATFKIKNSAPPGTYTFQVTMNSSICSNPNDPPTFTVDS